MRKRKLTKNPGSWQERIRKIRSGVLGWGANEGRDFPWRSDNRTPYEILVSELLLKRTTAVAAARIYETFLKKFPDPHSIVSTELNVLQDELSPVGLYRQRASGFKALSEVLVSRYDGKVPDNLNELLVLPQVGDYTSRAVMSFAFDRPHAIVDSNVQRIYNRVFKDTFHSTKSKELQDLADEVLPVSHHKPFNWALLDLGATVCRYDKPRCGACPVMSSCDYSRSMTCLA